MIKAKLSALQRGLFFWRHDALSQRILSGIFTVGALTACVKAVAFGKELIVASRFGTSDAMDAFTSAFVIWTFVVTLVAGAMPDAVVPIYAKAKKESINRAEDLVISSIWIYLGQIILCSLLVLLLGQQIIPLFTKEYSPEKQELTLRLFHHLAPFALLWGMSQFFAALLQARKQFKLASLAPITIPVVTVIALFGFDRYGIIALIYGILAGAALHLSLLVFGYFKDSSVLALFRPRKMWTPDIRLALNTSWPYLLSGLVMGSVALVDIGMAAWLEPGSVSALAYAERICAIGLTLAATATTEAFFPYLSELVASEQWARLRKTVIQFTKLILLVSFGIVAILYLTSDWLVATLFQRQEFTQQDSIRVASILRWLSFQVPFYIIAVLSARVVCAMLASKIIFVTSCINMVLNVTCNYYFSRLLGVEGIALSTAIVYAISATMLFSYFVLASRRQEQPPKTPPSQ